MTSQSIIGTTLTEITRDARSNKKDPEPINSMTPNKYPITMRLRPITATVTIETNTLKNLEINKDRSWKEAPRNRVIGKIIKKFFRFY